MQCSTMMAGIKVVVAQPLNIDHLAGSRSTTWYQKRFRQISDIGTTSSDTFRQNGAMGAVLGLIKTTAYDCAPSYEPGGRRFESFRARHLKQWLSDFSLSHFLFFPKKLPSCTHAAHTFPWGGAKGATPSCMPRATIRSSNAPNGFQAAWLLCLAIRSRPECLTSQRTTCYPA